MAQAGFRPADEVECRMVGESAEQAARDSFALAPDATFVAQLVDGTPILIFGVCPSDDPDVGVPWFLAVPEFRRGARTLKEQAPNWVEWMHRRYRKLENYVAADNHAALAFLSYLGFEIGGRLLPHFPSLRYFSRER
jgi:RimJ/RimL family protein N-acetyltransferase